MNKEKNISIVIADDHPMLLKGLKDELQTHGYDVVGTAVNGEQALGLILKHKPAIAILDIDMPIMTGFEVIKRAQKNDTTTRFIILSLYDEDEYVIQAKSFQVHGYLLKEDSFLDIKKCIDATLLGKQYFSSYFDTLSLQNASDELKNLKKLTPSEQRILKFIAQGESTSEIANSLSVSERTIEKHRSNIIVKLDLDSGNYSLTKWALIHNTIISSL